MIAPSDAPAAILRTIERRYRDLMALPFGERPDSSKRRSPGPRYLALEAEIRSLAQDFRAANEAIVTRWLTTTDDDEAFARMVIGDRSGRETPRRRAS
jgi:hypothetical protein